MSEIRERKSEVADSPIISIELTGIGIASGALKGRGR
jgi:hypothetical protein